MQSEEFDNKIKEAADHHHPAYDENAWVNMEKLLDRHLPQEKDDRRRLIFILLPFLLLGGGLWLLLSKPWKENNPSAPVKQSAAIEHIQPASDGDNGNSGKAQISTTTATISHIDAASKPVADQPQSAELRAAVAVNLINKKSKGAGTGILVMASNKKLNNQRSVLPTENEPDHDLGLTNSEKPEHRFDQIKSNLIDPDVSSRADEKMGTTKQSSAPINQPANDPVNNKPADTENTATTQSPIAKTAKAVAKKTSSFFFTLSAGPDISDPGTGGAGRVKLMAGAGLGYTFKNKVTVRTGFYTSRKIYTALPGEYHPPSDFWAYYPNLEKVNADCKVYEIPVTLSYNFGNSSARHNWFASAGLSSYLMKKETYNYYYKLSAGSPTINKEWTLLDQNKHYFSVLNLSAGYQRKLNKTTSLMIEPYLKLPLAGVGYGKVKLNSAGVLFSVGIKPFNHSKRPVH